MVEHIGQRDKQQRRTCARFDSVGEAGRDDDDAGHDRDEGVDKGDAERFACELLIL